MSMFTLKTLRTFCDFNIKEYSFMFTVMDYSTPEIKHLQVDMYASLKWMEVNGMPTKVEMMHSNV